MAGRFLKRAAGVLGLWLVLSVAMAAGVEAPIFEAIKAGDTAKVRALLDASPSDADMQDSHGDRPLAYAVVFGHLDVADMLLAKGARVTAPDHGGLTALHYAVATGRQDAAAYLLAHGADVNARSDAPFLHTPLYTVLQHAYQTKTGESPAAVAMAILLLDHGADVNAVTDSDKDSLLSSACYYGLKALIRLLLDRGADVNLRDTGGQTALHMAATQYAAMAAPGAVYDPELVSMLLKKGADPNAADKNGLTPLMLGAKYPEAVRLLLAARADPNAKDIRGGSALAAAALSAQTDSVKFLIAAGAVVNVADPQGNTPLHQARNKDIDGLLLAHGADINAKNKWSQTPLYFAVSFAPQESVDFLLSKGADISITGMDGSTPLHAAARAGKPDAAVSLINKGMDVNARDKEGETPLYLACMNKHTDVVKVLLARGADVNAQTQAGQTPLHAAVEAGATDIAKLLIADDADIHLKNSAGFMPLDKLSQSEVADLLSARKGGATPADVQAARTPSGPDNGVRQVNGIDLGYTGASQVIAAAGDQEPLVYALGQPGLSDLRLLLQDGYLKKHPAALNGNGYDNILILAIKAHRDDALELLLDSGVDPNLPTGEKKFEVNALSVAVSSQGSIGAEKILLDHGASPNSLHVMGGDWVLAMGKPVERKATFDKYTLLFQHGMNPANTLFSAVWDAAQAQNRLEKFCTLSNCKSDAQSIEDLASTAERAGNSDVAEFLRSTYAFKAATPCPEAASQVVRETCLPVTLTQSDAGLNQQYEQRMKSANTAAAQDALRSGQSQWLKSRDAACHLAYPWSNRDGWLSYVLADPQRTACVIVVTNKRIAALAGG